MSDKIKLATPDDMWKAYRGEKTRITAIRVPGCEPKTITGWIFPKEMHDFLKTMQPAANWYVYAITKPLTSNMVDVAEKYYNSETADLVTLSNCVPEFNRCYCALVLKPEYIDRYFVMCSDRVELGILETMFGMDLDGDSVIILKEEKVSDSDVLTLTEGEPSEQQISTLENICTLPLEIKMYRDSLQKYTETHPDEFPEDGFPIIPYTDTEIGPHSFKCPSDWLGKVTRITWKSDDDYYGIDKATVKCFSNQYIKFLKDTSLIKHVKLLPVMLGFRDDKTNEFNIQRLIGFMLSE